MKKQNKDFEIITNFSDKLTVCGDKNIEESTVKAHYYIGKIYTKTNDVNNAILHFEQVLKFNSEKYYSGNALYEMAKIRIKQQDFYEAFFTLQRAIDKNFKSKRLLFYKDFTEGVLYLIKRQGTKGVEILTHLMRKLSETNMTDRRIMGPTVQTLTYSSYIYRAYGYLFNGDHKNGHLDLIKAKAMENKLDKASDYNKTVAEGVLCTLETFEYIKAHDLFESAKVKFPDNKDPYLLQSLNIIMKCYKEKPGQWIDDSERRKMLIMAKNLIDEAIDKK